MRRLLAAAVCFALVGVTEVSLSAQSAQNPPAPRFGIIDNSFLVEEAFNQDPGVVQNILSFTRARHGDWGLVFTQEWPAPSTTHQFSYTIPVSRVDQHTGQGDVLLNYRFQAMSESPGRPAFSPRVSVILPTGDSDEGLGSGVVGWQVSLPFSKQRGDLYVHWNAELTYLPGVDAVAADGAATHLSLFSPTIAGSAIWQVSPTHNLLMEIVEVSNQTVSDRGRTRENQFTLSPGVRRGWNLTEKEIVVGAAVPVTFAGGGTSVALLGYFSYEARFKK